MSDSPAWPEPARDLHGVLEDAVRRAPGIIDIVLVDAEGVLVARAGQPASRDEADEVAVETIAAVGPIGRATASAGIGAVQEWVAVGDQGAFVVRRVPRAGLFLIVRAQPGEWIGRARLAARIAAGRVDDVL